MRRRVVDNGLEREVLSGLISSKVFLGQVAEPLRRELPQVPDLPLFKLVATWCVDYHRAHRGAPGRKRIRSIHREWARSNKDEELAESVSELLDGLDDDFGVDVNVRFLMDHLAKLLDQRKFTRLKEEMDALLDKGEVGLVKERVASYRSVEFGADEGIDFLNDDKFRQRTFAEARKPLISFEGPLGRFFNQALTRDALVGIQAPEKRGKTWLLIELAYQALLQKQKVALFQVGDLSEAQLGRRLWTRITEAPGFRVFDKRIKIPKSIDHDDEGKLTGVKYRFVNKWRVLSSRAAKHATEDLRRSLGVSNRPRLMLSVHPNSSINVRGIELELDRWESQKGFSPDCIFLDYPDILLPEDAKKEGRDQVNDTWKALRRLSQERHCLVVAPTQASAASYDARTQTMKHFSNDKRKLAHVTGMFALNQTPEEKEAGVMRLNWIVLREAAFNIKRCLWVGQCPTLGLALTCATF